MEEVHKKRVLVVDDDEAIRKYVEFILCREGCDVHTCSDGSEVNAALEQFPDPDLVITDIYMPRQDGIETLIALKGERPQLRVLAMSGAEDKQTVLKLADIFNADSILEKPFTGDMLIAAVRHVLQRQKSDMEHV